MSSAESVVIDYMKTFEASDAKAVATLFDDDGAVLAPPLPTIRGRTPIESTMEALFGALNVRIEELVIDRVRELGDAAFVEAHSREAVTNLAEQTTEIHHYRELFCLERSKGVWRIASYMFNTEPG